jgi:hypothetical protein
VLETHPMRGAVRFESFEVDVRADEERKHGKLSLAKIGDTLEMKDMWKVM